MTLLNVLPWIKYANQKGTAVGAFNANTMEQMQAIVMAAQAENAPVIIQISHNAARYVGNGDAILGLEYMAAIGKVAAESVDVPVSLHLDHASEYEVVEALRLGFTSVMFDGNDLPFEENVAATRRLRDQAHAQDVCLEAEIGDVPKPEGSDYDLSTIQLTEVADAVRFTENTGIDLLAIAIGSVHGIKDKHIRLDMDRLKSISEKVAVPFVLHGSSGVADEDISRGVRMGLSKVNIATQLNKAFTNSVRETLEKNRDSVDPRKYLGPARYANMAIVQERIRFLGTSGMADSL